MKHSYGEKERCARCERLKTCGMNCDDACSVIYTVEREVLFVDKTRPEACPFALNFGNSVACTCPVRKVRYFG